MARQLILWMLVASTGCTVETDIFTGGPTPSLTPAPPLPELEQTDRVLQVQIPKMDILFIVDNSCSMESEQTAMATNFPVFMDYFLGSGLDYHIGVVSTDTDTRQSGVLVNAMGHSLIDDTTPDAISVFQQMVSLGTGGSIQERGRRAAYTALELKADTDNAGFLRDEAALHLVFVSDEDDFSENQPSKAEFLQWMATKKYDAELVTAHTITALHPDDVGRDGCAGSVGYDYMAYAQATEGVQWSICTEDWSGFMDEIGLRASGLKREYFLSEVPVPDTIEVVVKNEAGVTMTFDQEADYVYNGQRNSVIFQEFIPDPFDEVLVNYEILAAENGE